MALLVQTVLCKAAVFIVTAAAHVSQKIHDDTGWGLTDKSESGRGEVCPPGYRVKR